MGNTQIESEFQEALQNFTKAKMQYALNMIKKRAVLSKRANESPGPTTGAEESAHGLPQWGQMMQHNKVELAKQETKIKRFVESNRMERVIDKLKAAVEDALNEDHDLIDRINSAKFEELYKQSENEYNNAQDILIKKTREYKKGVQFRIEQEVEDTEKFIKEIDKQDSPVKKDTVEYINKTVTMQYHKKSHRCLARRKTDKKLLCQNITLSKRCHWHVLS